MFDRKDIDAKYKWDLTKIYPTEDDFKKDYEEVEKIVEAITPVPGGVGAVTTSVLMKHVVEAAEKI